MAGTGPLVVVPATCRARRAWCSPTSCSTTCRSRLLRADRDGLARGPGRGRRRRCSVPRRRRRGAAGAARPRCAAGRPSPGPARPATWLRAGPGRAARPGVVVDYADTTASLAAGRGGSGCAPTGATSGAATRCGPGHAGHHLRGGARPAGPVRPAPDAPRPSCSRPRHRRARRRGPGGLARAGRTSATSRRSGPGAGSARPTPCSTPTGLGAFRVLEWVVWADPGCAGVDHAAVRPLQRGDDDGRADAIEDYCLEDRTFPPPRTFAARRAGRRPPAVRRGRASDLEAFWARQAARAARPGPTTSTPSSSGTCPSPSGSSAASSTSPTTASTATSRPARATRSPSTGRASRATPAPSPTPTSSPRCSGSPTCSRASASQQGRPGRHLHADDPRAAGGHAGLRPHRRRRTRWCSAASRADSLVDRINDAEAKVLDHRRRRLAAGRRRRRSRPTPTSPLADTPVDRARRRRAPHRARTST